VGSRHRRCHRRYHQPPRSAQFSALTDSFGPLVTVMQSVLVSHVMVASFAAGAGVHGIARCRVAFTDTPLVS
jgi:hypothetical protein